METTTKTLVNDKTALESLIAIMENPNHVWCKGIGDRTDREMAEHSDIAAHRDLFKANAISYKKGQKILILQTTYAEKITKANMFTKVQRTHEIIEVEVYQPAKFVTKKNVWMGDGYEDRTDHIIKYEDEKYVHTVDISALKSVPTI